MNKKGYSTGFAWVFALVSLFGLGVLYITFSQVFKAHLVPIIKDMANNTAISNIPVATVNEIFAGIDKYMAFFDALPYVLFFTIVIFMIVSGIRRERESEFQ